MSRKKRRWVYRSQALSFQPSPNHTAASREWELPDDRVFRKAMLSTFMQWIHLSAAAVGVGGMAFLVVILFPAIRQAEPGQREALVRSVLKRFRWAAWSVIVLLILTGIYNMSLVWEAPWGTYWRMLTLKIALALMVFLIALCLTVPLKALDWFRVRRERWLAIALGLGMAVILISAYLRRG